MDSSELSLIYLPTSLITIAQAVIKTIPTISRTILMSVVKSGGIAWTFRIGGAGFAMEEIVVTDLIMSVRTIKGAGEMMTAA